MGPKCPVAKKYAPVILGKNTEISKNSGILSALHLEKILQM